MQARSAGIRECYENRSPDSASLHPGYKKKAAGFRPPPTLEICRGPTTPGQNFTSPHAPISRVWISVVVSLRRRSSLYATATRTPLVTGNATPAFQ